MLPRARYQTSIPQRRPKGLASVLNGIRNFCGLELACLYVLPSFQAPSVNLMHRFPAIRVGNFNNLRENCRAIEHQVQVSSTNGTVRPLTF